jgi:hypothetical protein
VLLHNETLLDHTAPPQVAQIQLRRLAPYQHGVDLHDLGIDQPARRFRPGRQSLSARMDDGPIGGDIFELADQKAELALGRQRGEPVSGMGRRPLFCARCAEPSSLVERRRMVNTASKSICQNCAQPGACDVA